jgi:2-keto-4-pentenoate hydratase
VTLSKNDVEQVIGGGTNVLDSPLLALAHLAEVLAQQSRFPPIRAGELVSTGTLTVPLPVAPGDEFASAIDGIDLPDVSLTAT